MMNDDDSEEYLIDLVEAINRVSEDHDASMVDKLSAVGALGDAASDGQWYTLTEDAE